MRETAEKITTAPESTSCQRRIVTSRSYHDIWTTSIRTTNASTGSIDNRNIARTRLGILEDSVVATVIVVCVVTSKVADLLKSTVDHSTQDVLTNSISGTDSGCRIITGKSEEGVVTAFVTS